MESTHVVLESVREGTITPDDAMRILVPQYAPDMDFIPDVESIIEYMRDCMVETGRFPEEFVDFNLCEGDDDNIGCHKLMVWDDVVEDFLHLAPSDCHWCKLELATPQGAT